MSIYLSHGKLLTWSRILKSTVYTVYTYMCACVCDVTGEHELYQTSLRRNAKSSVICVIQTGIQLTHNSGSAALPPSRGRSNNVDVGYTARGQTSLDLTFRRLDRVPGVIALT